MAKFHKRSIKIMFSLLFVLLLIVTLMLVFKKDTWPPEDLSSNTTESPFGGSEDGISGNIVLTFTLDIANMSPSISTNCSTNFNIGDISSCSPVTTLDGELFVMQDENNLSITPRFILNRFFLNK